MPYSWQRSQSAAYSWTWFWGFFALSRSLDVDDRAEAAHEGTAAPGVERPRGGDVAVLEVTHGVNGHRGTAQVRLSATVEGPRAVFQDLLERGLPELLRFPVEDDDPLVD